MPSDNKKTNKSEEFLIIRFLISDYFRFQWHIKSILNYMFEYHQHEAQTTFFVYNKI